MTSYMWSTNNYKKQRTTKQRTTDNWEEGPVPHTVQKSGLRLAYFRDDGGDQPGGASGQISSGLTGSACSRPSLFGSITARWKSSGATGLPDKRLNNAS